MWAKCQLLCSSVEMLRVVMAGKSRRCFSGTVLVGSETLVLGEAKIVTVGEAQPITCRSGRSWRTRTRDVGLCNLDHAVFLLFVLSFAS